MPKICVRYFISIDACDRDPSYGGPKTNQAGKEEVINYLFYTDGRGETNIGRVPIWPDTFAECLGLGRVSARNGWSKRAAGRPRGNNHRQFLFQIQAGIPQNFVRFKKTKPAAIRHSPSTGFPVEEDDGRLRFTGEMLL